MVPMLPAETHISGSCSGPYPIRAAAIDQSSGHADVGGDAMTKVNAIRAMVRPIMGIAFTGAAIYLAITGKIKPEMFWGTVGIIIGFYFGERAAGNNTPTQ